MARPGPADSPGSADPRGEAERVLAEHRPALRAYAYRMLGSLADADDAVQDAYDRAWRAWEELAVPAARRRWLYTITTRVCLDALERRRARVGPWPTHPAGRPQASLEDRLADEVIDPVPEALAEVGPDAMISAKESIGLAFVAALQGLPGLQRAALLLRDVVGFSAREAAEVLERSADAVESALSRARAAVPRDPDPRLEALGPAERALLARYLAAWEQRDVDALAATLREDCRLSMPPRALWLSGRADIHAFLGRILPSLAAVRVVPLSVSGGPGAAVWVRSRPGEPFHPHAVQALTPSPDGIAALCTWLVPSLVGHFARSSDDFSPPPPSLGA